MDLARWRVDLERTAAAAAKRPFPYRALALWGLGLAVVVSWSSVLVVVMGRVVPSWMPAGLLVLVSFVLMSVRAVLRRRSPDGSISYDDLAASLVLTAPADASRALRLPPRESTPRLVGRVLLAVVALASTGFNALGDLGAEYLVLRPTGPGGCTAIVRETAFLMAGTGEVYAVAGATGVAWGPSGSWFADDGYRPVAAGSYRLTWGRADGALVVEGTSTDPVHPAIHELDCG
ncbi:hypothetical protein [Streptomyces sp. SID13726]|uniref:hypothetical protein n=1 Tax=Streptomyces sp. SID13726 TaxID=2706058 RepID=UPI0013BA13B4|nr:hypothetical protein [Streptomyces sp. SID13726]NEB04900.1 hypothetical protein [Streptomyces sp. SID13726]